MMNILKFGKLILSCIIACVLLSIVALVYNNSGAKTTNNTGATSSKWDGVQFVSNMVEGMGWFITDQNGFNNYETKEKIDILVMGDSHVEAKQVLQRENFTSVLDEITEYECYSIGISGTYVDSCVQNLQMALAEYHPLKYFIINVHDGTLKLKMDKMMDVISGNGAVSTVRFENGIMNYIKRVPCVKPLLYGLKNWATLKNTAGGGTIQLTTELPEGYSDTLHQLLSIVSDTAKENSITPIILYHPAEELNSNGTVTYNTEQTYLECFASACADLNIVFIDMTEPFMNLYATEHQLAHGFINTAVGYGHLNKYGHRVIAEKLAEVIQGLEAE